MSTTMEQEINRLLQSIKDSRERFHEFLICNKYNTWLDEQNREFLGTMARANAFQKLLQEIFVEQCSDSRAYEKCLFIYHELLSKALSIQKAMEPVLQNTFVATCPAVDGYFA